MNKKIFLVLLICFNSTMPAPWSWESIKEQVSKSAAQVTTSIVALAAISAGIFAYVAKGKNTQSQPASSEQTIEQKFLAMLAKAIESDIFRLDCALRYQQPCDMTYDALHVWHKGTQNADTEFSHLHHHARVLMNYERYLRTQNEVMKEREVLVAMREAVKEAKNKK